MYLLGNTRFICTHAAAYFPIKVVVEDEKAFDPSRSYGECDLSTCSLLLCPFQYIVPINGMSFRNVPSWVRKPQLWYPRLIRMLNLHGMCSNRSRATFGAADWHYCVNSSKWFSAYLQFKGSCKHCSKHFTQKLVAKLLVVVIISTDGCG